MGEAAANEQEDGVKGVYGVGGVGGADSVKLVNGVAGIENIDDVGDVAGVELVVQVPELGALAEMDGRADSNEVDGNVGFFLSTTLLAICRTTSSLT